MRTQVAIIGAGPAGLLLAHLLHQAGIETLVLERQSRAYIEGRVRAGVLEQVTISLLERLGLGERMHREGLRHEGVRLAYDDVIFRVDLTDLTGGAAVMVYGQSEVMRDLNDAVVERGLTVIYEAHDVELHDLDSDHPSVTWRNKDGEAERIDCDYVVGCDGYHGVSRASIPSSVLKTYEKAYPFGWLGILADVPPCGHELIYANHSRGFALASMRSPTRSRYYIQCAIDEAVEAWPDERFWDELCLRLGPEAAGQVTRGPSFEKSIAPLRSFVAEPMRWGRLFLAGDAAHIVPPTGAKGLNLAASDVAMLSQAFIDHYDSGDTSGIDGYSARALARVWKAERFSWWFTGVTHRFPETGPLEHRLQEAELGYIRDSRAAQTVLAENYVGLPIL